MSKDDVAARSGFLCTYMSNHPDTLVAYVRHQGKINERVASARMTSIDRQSMSLSYKLKSNPTVEQGLSIKFDPPLTGYEEVKPRLLAMKLDAEESLGMTPRPQLKPFHFPSSSTTTIVALAALIYVTFHGPGTVLLRKVIGGDTTITYIWWFTMITHTLEALYTLHLCRKHRTGLIDGALYVIATVVVGYPIWSNMRKRIQRMRIESIEKVH